MTNHPFNRPALSRRILTRSIASQFRGPRPLALSVLLPFVVFSTPGTSSAVNGVWSLDGGGGYAQVGSWVGGTVALGADAVADFSQVDITANRTVNLNANRTIGSLITGDAVSATHDWIFAPNGAFKLTLLTNTEAPTITVVNRTTTISAPIAGTQGFTKLGAGTLALTNAANTLTGGINLNGGTLTFVSGALGSNLVTNGGNTGLTWNANLDDISGQIKVGDSFTLTLNLSNNIGEVTTFATALQTGPLGTGALTKANASNLIISAANTYTGGTRVNNGRLILIGGENRLSEFGALSFGNGANSGIVQLGNTDGASNQTVTGLSIFGTGAANAVVGGHTTNSVFTVNHSNPVTFNGTLGGGGTNENNLALVKSGAGTLTLGGNNTFAGDVTVAGGNLVITKTGALGVGTKIVNISAATNTPSLQLDGNSGPISLASGIGFVTSNDDVLSPAIVNTAGNNVIAGTISPAAGGAGTGNTRIAVNGGSLTLTGGIAPAIDTAGALGLILDGSSEGAVTGVIANNGGRLLGITKEGTGTWTLSGNNSYSGPTLVSAGRLNIATSQTGGGALTVADGATLGLTLAASGQSFNTSALTLGTASGVTVSLNLGASGNPTIPVINAGTFSTASSGTSTLNIVATGLTIGQVPLIGYTGNIGGGGYQGLLLGTLPARVTASLVNDSANSRVSLNVSAFDLPRWIGGIDGNWDADPDGTGALGTLNWREVTSGIPTRYLQGAGGIDSVRFDDTPGVQTSVNLTTILTPAGVAVNTSSNAFVFSGSGKLSGSAGITKEGTSALTLVNTGGNDYTGLTTINGGTLQIGDGVTAGGGQLGTGPVVANARLVFNRPDDLDAGNAISGAGSLIKQGQGVVSLSGNNAGFDGAIVIEGGTLKLGSGSALGSIAGNTTIAAGAALDVTGLATAEPLQLNGGIIKSLSGTAGIAAGNISLVNGGLFDSEAGILTVSGLVSGTGGLVKNGAGTVLFSGANTFSGGLTVNAGTAVLASANSYTGGTTISGGILQIGATGGAGLAGSLGSGDIVLAPASGTATLTILRGDTASNIGNIITSSGVGANAIVIGVTGASSPSGTVTFSAANTFTGNITINGGALRITNSAALGIGAKTVSIGSNAGPSLQLDGTGGDITLPAGINFTASSDGTIANVASNDGAIVNLAGNNTINGNIALVNGGGGNGRIQALGGFLTVNGRIDPTGSTGVRTLLLGGPANGTVAGIVADGAFVVSVTKDGSGTWNLSGANTFSGGVTVNAGTLKMNTIESAGIAQPLGVGMGAITLGNASGQGILEYAGNTAATIARPVAIGGVGGGIVKNSGDSLLTLAGTVTKNGRTLILTGGAFDVTGSIAGTAANSDLIVDAATVQLSSLSNSYNGPTLVRGGGTLKLGAANGIPIGSSLTLGEASNNTGGTFDLNGFDQTVNKLTVAGGGANSITNGAASGTNVLTVNGASAFAGAIHDGATAQTALTKSGSGIFELAGINDFGGATIVNGGTLLVSGSIRGTLGVTVDGGGILAGNGVIETANGGNLTVALGGALAPGVSTGPLTLELPGGSLDLSAVSGGFGYLQFELGASTSRIVLSDGVLNLGTGFDLDDFNFTDGGGLLPGSYVLFDTSSSIVGSLGSNLAGTFGDYDISLQFQENTSSQQDIVLVVVPEPGSALLFLVGLAAVGIRRRSCVNALR